VTLADTGTEVLALAANAMPDAADRATATEKLKMEIFNIT
jgi:hypothetical protein